MKVCKNCGVEFKTYIVLETGERKNLGSRKFCLTCSPLYGHNTKPTAPIHVTAQSLIEKNDPSSRRVCTKCGEEKQQDAFYFRKDRNAYHCWCKSCVNKASYDSTKKLKIKAVEYKGGKCELCGYNKCISALDFHHLDPTQKDFGISDQSRKKSTWEIIQPELDKCILVCSNCHRELHHNLEG